MSGDYRQFQKYNMDACVDSIAVAATDYSTASNIITAKSANHTIYVQRISIQITTYSAKTWTFQDSAGTPVPIASISIPAAAPTTAGDEQFVVDFGPKGTPLSLGKNFQFKMSAAGAAGVVHVEAYQKLTGAVAQASTN